MPFFLLALVFARPSAWLFGKGLALAFAGELVRWASVAFSGPTTRSRSVEAEGLVTHGPYGIVRNPIYLGNFLVGLGMTLSSAALYPYLALAFVALFWAEYTLIIVAEENYLAARFPEEFVDYCRRVHRIMPLPRRTIWRGGKWRTGLRSERSTLLVNLGYYLALGLRVILGVCIAR